MAGAPGARAPGRGGGYLKRAHGPTVKGQLRIAWEYPVYEPEAAAEPTAPGGTFSVQERRALPAADAYRILAGEDQRPLLVLRECFWCNGTDDALLSTSEDNERTFLLSQWFHCVKLQPDTLDEDHPFRNLFAADDPSHLFVSTWSGEKRLDLLGDQSRTELWNAMETVLQSEYSDSVRRPLKELTSMLAKFDDLDVRIAQLEDRVDELIEEDGKSSPKLRRTRAQLEKAKKERSELLARRQKISDLGLTPTPAPAPEGAGTGARGSDGAG